MKKIIALLLAMVMALSLLTACGGNDTPGTNDESNPSTGNTQPSDDGPAYDTVKLTFSTTYQAAETSGQVITYFTDYVTEKSGGAITFDIKWGGTVAGNGEEIGFIQGDAIDMSAINHNMYSDILPLLNFPGQADVSQENCMNYFNHIIYENAETSALIQSQIEALGIKILGFTAAGNNAFCSKKEAVSLDALKSMTLGAGMNVGAFESLGFNVLSVTPWDGYDSLSRGIVNSAYMATSAMVSLNWHEVAPYFLSANIYTAGNFFTLNLNKWNSFSVDTQALFEEAMAAAADYSVELVAAQEAEVPALLESAGGKFTELGAEDAKALAEALFISCVADCRALGQSGGCADEMETILKACSDFLGMPLE